MAVLFAMLTGLALGVALMAIWKRLITRRSEERTSKVVALQVLGDLRRNNVVQLCGNNYPTWLLFTTFERAKWINLQLDRSWPFIAEAASKLIESKIEPHLAAYCPSGIRMKFTKLFLGDIAPHIEGIKIQKLADGVLAMELDFKWGGNPSIIIAIEALAAAKFPVQIKNLKFYAVARVIMRLIEDIPCISGVAFSIMNEPKPRIMYDLKLIGGNITSYPFISDLLKDIVESAIADNLEWPERVIVPIADPSVDLSTLELKPQGRLTLTVMRANLSIGYDMFGKSDFYVVAYIRRQFKHKTKVIQNSLQPEWNEVLELDVVDKETQSLVLQVKDEDIGIDKLVGTAVLPLAKLKDEVVAESILDLALTSDKNKQAGKESSSGSISISIKYHVFSNEEQVAAMEAEKSFLEAKKAAVEPGNFGTPVDAIGSAVGGAAQLLLGGVGMLGSGLDMVGSGLGKLGNFSNT